jgi:hypothetical protein
MILGISLSNVFVITWRSRYGIVLSHLQVIERCAQRVS